MKYLLAYMDKWTPSIVYKENQFLHLLSAVKHAFIGTLNNNGNELTLFAEFRPCYLLHSGL